MPVSRKRKKPAKETCWRCEGSGKVRQNRMVDGRYQFGFDTCRVCKGTGTTKVKHIR